MGYHQGAAKIIAKLVQYHWELWRIFHVFWMNSMNRHIKGRKPHFLWAD